MNQVTLFRYETTELGTMGRITLSERTIHTLEPPWKNNEPFVSCIPTGSYECRMEESPRFGLRYKLRGTEPRTHILIHPGNFVEDTYGCILLGLEKGTAHKRDRDEPAVWNSRPAIIKFESAMEKRDLMLHIKWTGDGDDPFVL